MTTPGRMFSRKRPAQAAHTLASSLIAHGTRITGDVSFEGSLYLEGHVDGQVTANEPAALLTIGEQGLVRGDIRVPAAIIHGSVCGNVYAMERIELAATARVTGDLCYRSIVVAAGAQMHGLLQHTPDREEGAEMSTAPADATGVSSAQIIADLNEATEPSATIPGTGELDAPSDMRSRKRIRHHTNRHKA